jgi:hypothetical protein
MNSACVSRMPSSFVGACISPRKSVVLPPRRCLVIQNAHKKGAGSTKNGRDSNPKFRGVKVYGGQPVTAGGIIVRQVGNKVRHIVHVLRAWCGCRSAAVSRATEL